MIVFKFLLILLLVFFLLGRVGWFLLKVLMRKAASQGQYHHSQRSDRYEGDIRIDYIPEQEQEKRRTRTSKKDDYTDYEEVK